MLEGNPSGVIDFRKLRARLVMRSLVGRGGWVLGRATSSFQLRQNL